jgi:D-lyxose ketol-isomerase
LEKDGGHYQQGVTIYQLCNATPDEVTSNDVSLYDGVRHNLKAGEIVRLAPGESITLEPRCYHKFWGEGRVLIGEISLVNDDHNDNRFFEPIGRFPTIEEDVPALHLLCNDYSRYYQIK